MVGADPSQSTEQMRLVDGSRQSVLAQAIGSLKTQESYCYSRELAWVHGLAQVLLCCMHQKGHDVTEMAGAA